MVGTNATTFGVSQKLICAPTQYAIDRYVSYREFTEEYYDTYLKKYGYTRDVIGSRGDFWWLRSPGSETNKACYVYYDGYAGARCAAVVNSLGYAVRPAMWIEY